MIKNTVKTKYIDFIIGREELENMLKKGNNFKNNLLISIINPYSKYNNVKNQIKALEHFLKSKENEIEFPIYIGNGKFEKKKFDKRNNTDLEFIKNYLEKARNYLKNAKSDFDINAIPINDEFKNKFFDVLTISFWDVTEDLGFYKPISDEKTEEIAKFIYKHKENILNKNLKFIIHCSAGISRSASVGMAIHCCLDFNGDISEFKKENCKIFNHKRYRPNEYVFKKICEKYKKEKNKWKN